MLKKDKQPKYIFVTGGVLSGLGKGITAASIGNILKARGLDVTIQKCDPYLNVDAGTLNPAEHGECYVTFDGAETDLDLGHYERFLDAELTRSSSLMSGRLYRQLIEDERAGKYLGKTVQVIPHLTNAIQEEIRTTGHGHDVHIVEIGGTVGDYEGLAFIEAIRELAMRVGKDNCVFVHVVYIPYLGASKEFKTKPAQNATRELRGFGIVPDILVARSEQPPNGNTTAKLSAFTGVKQEAVVLLPNAKTVYEVPLSIEEQGIGDVITKMLGLPNKKPDLKSWQDLVRRAQTQFDAKLTVGIVAKYMDNEDTYMSVFEALRAAAWKHEVSLTLKWIEAEGLETAPENVVGELGACDGIVVPGGFGPRGVEGKIAAAQYAWSHKLPYLGLCLGLQIAVIAAARLHGLTKANSTEMDKNTPDPVIHTMDDQVGKEETGGTMRLGNYPCELIRGSLAAKAYRTTKIEERHRHRYECNNDYRPVYEDWGIKASGVSPDGRLVEVIEGADHPFLLASQFHPEFKSRPNKPHPMFDAFIKHLKAAQQNQRDAEKSRITPGA